MRERWQKGLFMEGEEDEDRMLKAIVLFLIS